MANKIDLAHNEVIILHEEDVAHGGITASNSDELYLTNTRIICVNKGTFGKIKNKYSYPLNQIKKYQEKPQAKLREIEETPVLEVNLFSGVEYFCFADEEKETVQKWVNEISILLTGEPASFEEDSSKRKQDDVFRYSLLGTFAEIGKEYKKIIGIKSKSDNRDPVSSDKRSDDNHTRVTKKCISCSAPLVGIKGQNVRCKYCDTNQTL